MARRWEIDDAGPLSGQFPVVAEFVRQNRAGPR